MKIEVDIVPAFKLGRKSGKIPWELGWIVYVNIVSTPIRTKRYENILETVNLCLREINFNRADPDYSPSEFAQTQPDLKLG